MRPRVPSSGWASPGSMDALFEVVRSSFKRNFPPDQWWSVFKPMAWFCS